MPWATRLVALLLVLGSTGAFKQAPKAAQRGLVPPPLDAAAIAAQPPSVRGLYDDVIAPLPGLLSPAFVMKLEQRNFGGQRSSKLVAKFLGTYKEQGPMACLPFLSDPEVLPVLTKAMGDCQL